MQESVSLTFNTLPSVARTYPKLLLDRSPTLLPQGRSLPPIEANIRSVTADPRAVTAYNAVCGPPVDAATLPITYPHVLAMPLHMAMLSHAAFGVRLMGLVHLRNTIHQYRAIGLQEVVDIHCEVTGPDETDRGQEFDLRTILTVSDQVVWEESSVFLARRKAQRGDRRSEPEQPLSGAGVRTTSFQASTDIGRRYARVSGDINPIHLSALSARLFGFPRAIAHGMWSMARVVSELQGRDAPQRHLTLEIVFKTPVLLPGWVQLSSLTVGGSTRFELRDADGVRPHLVGRLGAPEGGT